MATLSYTTKIGTPGGGAWRLTPTPTFTIGPTDYCGVVTVDQLGTDFVVDQRNSAHYIRTTDTIYVTALAIDAAGLLVAPSAVRTVLGNAPGVIVTTTRNVVPWYLVASATTTATASTVNLSTTQTAYLGGATGATVGRFLTVANQAWVTLAPTVFGAGPALFTFGAPGASAAPGFPVDPAGNPVLEYDEHCVAVTATDNGPVMGTYDGGMRVPAFARARTQLATGGARAPGTAHAQPFLASTGSDLTTGGVYTPNWLAPFAVPLVVKTGNLTFGSSLVCNDMGYQFAVGDPQLGGTVEVYNFSITTAPPPWPDPIWTLTAGAGETVGKSLAASSDLAVLFVPWDDGTDSEVRVYVRTGDTDAWARPDTVWSPGPPYLAGDTDLGARLSCTKDGRTAAVISTSSKVLLVLQDTSCDGSWSSAMVTDLTAQITGPSTVDVTISTEGDYLMLISDTILVEMFAATADPMTVVDTWANTNAPYVNPYPGTGPIQAAFTSHQGLYTFIVDASLPNGATVINRVGLDQLSPQGALGGAGAPVAGPTARVSADTNFGSIATVNGTDANLVVTTRSSGILMPLTTIDFSAILITGPITIIRTVCVPEVTFVPIVLITATDGADSAVMLVPPHPTPDTTVMGAMYGIHTAGVPPLPVRNTLPYFEAPVVVNPGIPLPTPPTELQLTGTTTDPVVTYADPVPTAVIGRAGSLVTVNATVVIDTFTSAGTGDLQLTIVGTTLPAPYPPTSAGIAIQPVGTLAVETNTVVLGSNRYNLYCKYVDATHIGLYDADGAIDAADLAGVGTINISLSYVTSME